MNPTFKYEIQETQTDFVDSSVISYEDNRRFVSYFGNWRIIQTTLPAIAETILTMIQKEHFMAAKIDTYVKELIDRGVYRFSIDKQGRILPTIRDNTALYNKFVWKI